MCILVEQPISKEAPLENSLCSGIKPWKLIQSYVTQINNHNDYWKPHGVIFIFLKNTQTDFFVSGTMPVRCNGYHLG